MEKMYIVKYVLFSSDFNETWIFSTEFGKSPKYQIWKSVKWKPSCSVRTDGQTNNNENNISFFAISRTRLRNAVCHFGVFKDWM